MSTFHAVVWMDHSEAHVVMFDREHMEAQRIRSRSHHKHQGKTADNGSFFGDVARALMYMDVRYEGGTHGVTGLAEPDLRLTNDLNLIGSSVSSTRCFSITRFHAPTIWPSITITMPKAATTRSR